MNLFLNLLDCNLIEREIKKEKVQMKTPVVWFMKYNFIWAWKFSSVYKTEYSESSPYANFITVIFITAIFQNIP